nr:ionotropic receptor 75c [Pachyrhinus yasumatsui]
MGNQDQSLTNIVDIFKNFKNRMDMNVKIFKAVKNGSYSINEIYNPGINVGVKIRNIGSFTDGKIVLKLNTSYYESRKNMTEVLIRSANVIKYPFKTSFHEYMVDLKLRHFDIYSKFHYQLFLVLQEIHGFSYNTTLRPSWFGNTSSGEDGGIAKMLWEDTADISSAGCILRLLGNERMDFYDFIVPYYKFRSYFYFRNPGIVKPNFNEVLKPFTRSSWFATLYITAIVCMCIEIAYFVEKRRENRRNRTWMRSVFIVIAVFSQQGLDTIPTHLAGRIILLHLLICSILLYNYYTSSLVSSLISTEPEVLKTIKELLESTLRVGIELQPYIITYVLDRSKTDRNLFLLNRTKIFEHNRPNFLSVEEGVKEVHQGGYAYHTESITAYPLIARTFEQDAICDLAEIILINSDTSLMAQKKSQYKKLFQVSLRKMWTSGIMKKLYKTWVASKPECLSSARVISVGISDLFLPYFLLAVGVLTSLVILTLEVSWKRVHQRYGQQWGDLHVRKLEIPYFN